MVQKWHPGGMGAHPSFVGLIGPLWECRKQFTFKFNTHTHTPTHHAIIASSLKDASRYRVTFAFPLRIEASTGQ